MSVGAKTVLCGQCAGVGYIRDKRRDENGELWHHECAACSGRGLVAASLAADTVTVGFRQQAATAYSAADAAQNAKVDRSPSGGPDVP